MLAVESSSYDFGTVLEDKTVEHMYRISNKGKSLLRIIDIKSGNESLTAYAYKNILNPGDSTEVKVIFDSFGFWGDQDHRIYLDTNDPKRLRATLHLKGKVLADYRVIPRVVRIRLEGRKKQFWSSATIRNTSDKILRLVRMEMENNRVYAEMASKKLPLSLKPSQEAELKIRFEPSRARITGRDVVKVYIQGRTKPIEIAVRIKLR